MLLQYFPEYVTIKKFLDVTLVPDLESLSPQFRNLFALEPSHGFCCQQYVNVGGGSKVGFVTELTWIYRQSRLGPPGIWTGC